MIPQVRPWWNYSISYEECWEVPEMPWSGYRWQHTDDRKCQLWERERQTSISKIWVWAEFQDACLPTISQNSAVTKTPVRINTCTPYRQPGSRLKKQAQVLIPKERGRLLHQLAGRSGFLAALPVLVWSHLFERSPVRSRIQMQATEDRTDFASVLTWPFELHCPGRTRGRRSMAAVRARIREKRSFPMYSNANRTFLRPWTMPSKSSLKEKKNQRLQGLQTR